MWNLSSELHVQVGLNSLHVLVTVDDTLNIVNEQVYQFGIYLYITKYPSKLSLSKRKAEFKRVFCISFLKY